MLNVNRLAVLHAVVGEGSVSAAAALLGYTPSAISQQIAVLEREAGTELLERVGRRVRPTPAGTLLAERATGILERVSEAEDALAALVDGRTGRLRVTSFESAGTGLVPIAIARTRERHPGVDLQLSFAEQGPALAALNDDRADVAIIIRDVARVAEPDPGPREQQGLEWHLLVLDPYFVAVPRAHRLAERREIALADLAEERLVNGDHEPDCPCYDAILDACSEAGFRARFAVEVSNYPTAQSLVAAGVGPALIPLLGLSPAVHEGIVVRPLVEPGMTRRIYAVTRSARSRDPLVATMLDSLSRAADELVVPALR